MSSPNIRMSYLFPPRGGVFRQNIFPRVTMYPKIPEQVELRRKICLDNSNIQLIQCTCILVLGRSTPYYCRGMH